MPAITDLPLRDIHLPETVSWWPPAPGWWMLASLVVIIAVGTWWLRRYHHQRRALYALQSQLEQIRQHHRDTDDHHSTAERCSVLLRRACISFFPREDVASLTGDDWLSFLDEHTDSNFSATHARKLTESIYRQAEGLSAQGITDLIDDLSAQLPVLFRNGRRR